MLITPTMNYRDVQRGMNYKLLSDGRDYQEISIKGRPTFVPNYVFDSNNFPMENDNESERQSSAKN